MMNPEQRSRILIADHDQTFLDQLADRLLQMDMEVDFAENGRTAIQLIDSESYDLIVTEIAMPIYNGLEILRRAKERDSRIPILITSFSATTDWAEQAIKEGAHSYLLRPLNRMKEFDLAIEDALQSKQIPDKNSFFEQVFSKGVLGDSSPTQADIPLPDWEKDLDSSLEDLEIPRPDPLNPDPAKQPQARTSLPEGYIELNSQGQILNCDPAARKWLMLEGNSSDRPIKRFIKDLGTTSTLDNAELQVNGRNVHMRTKRIRDRMGSERIILCIREVEMQGSGFPASSTVGNKHPQKQQGAGAKSAPAFGGNLKQYNPDTVDHGWSPLLFIDQMKKNLKDEVERIKGNNPLRIFEPQPEEVDPEVVITMSQRLSDVSRGRRSSL
jgi:CheY-like chemotaxis protein